MTVYVKRSCPHCGSVIENWQRSYVAIGEPFLTCPACNKKVVVDHIEEWESKDLVDKGLFIFKSIFAMTLYSIALYLFGISALQIVIKDKDIFFTQDIGMILSHVRRNPQWMGFVLRSAGVQALSAVAQAGEVMPPKTTYFYPKVPTGFTLIPLDQKID